MLKYIKRSLCFLLVLALSLSMVYFGPGSTVFAASAQDYISTSYASNLSVKTTKVVGLKPYPVASATDTYTIGADTMLSVKALHKNTAGTYWYEVLYYDVTLYVDATATTMVDHLTGDVTVADLMSPAALGYGQGFPIEGKITSTLNKLGDVTAAVHYNSKIHSAPAISSTDSINGYSYNMASSTLDYNLIFSDLAAGSYTYLLTVEAISYYINNGALTTSTQTVVLENKPLVVTSTSSPNTVVAKGIDVSVHQGTINWASVASQIDFAILRIGYEYTLDSQFKNNAAGCNTYGIPFGVYIYSYAESEAEAIAEAEFVISALKNYDVDLPVFFDIEDECQASLGSAAIQNIVKAFCDTIRDAGYEPGLYTFLSWFNSYFYDSYYNSLPKWVAQVGVSSCSYAKGLTMWQYSWTGSFTGISGDVDCNYYYGEFPGKSTDSSYLKNCTYYPSNIDATISSAVNMRTYPSTDYSVIEELSAGTQVRVTGVYKNSYGNYWYEVEKDGVTGYISASYATVDTFRYDDLAVVDPTMEDLALNSGYYLRGKLSSVYNNLYKVNAKVYSGEDTLATPVLTSSVTSNSKEYNLYLSDVCDGTIFSDLSTGYYTYEISTDVKNYYVSNGSLVSEEENVVLWTAPFTVGGAEITPPATVVCSHNVVTNAGKSATCTADGLTDGSYCSKCGLVLSEQAVIPATGHNYTKSTIAANCQDYEKYQYSCANCGDTYSVYAYEENSEWSETKPDGVDETLIETATQYRYSDKQTITSYTPNLANYTLVSKTWETDTSGTVNYVSEWPSGFVTTHSLYSTYNKTKKTASETDTAKTVINSDKIVGNLFYHWCYGTYTGGPINRTTSPTNDGSHTTFHAYYSPLTTVDPTTLTAASDGSVVNGNADCCTDSHWFYYIPVYSQSYTTYKAKFTYEGWGDWSEWSLTAVTASSTRQVETRTVYRYTGKALGDHSFVDGVCIYCGETDACKHPSHDTSGVCADCGETVSHSYVDGICSVCGKVEVPPEIKLAYPTASLESEIRLNIYFSVSGMDGVSTEDMGMITWATPQTSGTIDTADSVIAGVESANGMLVASTDGIPAKRMGDLIYFKLYAKQPDGTYVYSDLRYISPKIYATNKINSSSDKNLVALCVSILNYGAAAQTYLGYKPYDLMNAGLTAEQKAMAEDYFNGMMDSIDPPVSSKAGVYTNSGGFASKYPTVSLESEFAINYYFTLSNTPDTTPKMFYWDEETYNSVSSLSPSNATGLIVMEQEGDSYIATIEGIAAKNLDDTIYIAAGYMYNGSSCCTGVLPYSIGAFCVSQISGGSEVAKPMAEAIAVYGYYAKTYLASISG